LTPRHEEKGEVMGEKRNDISLKVHDNKVTFTVSKLKEVVAENEDVTLIWALANEPGVSWSENPQGIVFAPGWPVEQPAREGNEYRVSYRNDSPKHGRFKYTINVHLTGGRVPELLSFDPEVQNDPPDTKPEP
jgi:hypothetical protein